MNGTELLRLIAAQICVHASMAGLRLAVSLLALQQGYSAAAVGLLVAMFALAPVFLALPAGRLADRYGLQRPVALAVAAALAGAGLVLIFPVFPVLCLGALLSGGATGVTTIALQRHVGRAAENSVQLRQMFSWLAIAPAVANFVGPFVAGVLIDHAAARPGELEAYRICFAALALLPLMGWCSLRGVSEPALEPRPVDAAGTHAWDLLREPMFRRLLFVNWLQSSSWDVHAFALPLLGHERGLSASVIGSILGTFAMAAALVRLVLPVLSARTTERQVIGLSVGVVVLVFALYPLLHSPWWMGALSALLGVALGAVQPMVLSLLHQITPPARHGEALGLRLMVMNASSVAMPLLFGTLGVLLGVGGVFWVAGSVVALGTPAVRGLPTAWDAPGRTGTHSRPG